MGPLIWGISLVNTDVVCGKDIVAYLEIMCGVYGVFGWNFVLAICDRDF